MSCRRLKIDIPLAILCQAVALCGGAAQIPEISFGIIEPPVVAQQDITVMAPVSNQPGDPKPLECSGLAWLDGRLVITSDRHQHLLFMAAVDMETLAIAPPEPMVIIHNEQYVLNDAESVTVLKSSGRTSLYAMCSLSNAPDGQPLPQRRHLFGAIVRKRQTLQLDRGEVLNAGGLRSQVESCFNVIRARPYFAYDVEFPGEDKNTYRWGNVEGIAFSPDAKHLLCGMRNPLFADKAIIFSVGGVTEAMRARDGESMNVKDVFLLDLGGRGVSDLAWDPVTQGYLMTAAKSSGRRLDPDSPYPPNTLDSALFWWNGQKADAPVQIAAMPDMTIEAVCRLGNSPWVAIGSDEGDVSEGRTARQSIITILEFTSVPR